MSASDRRSTELAIGFTASTPENSPEDKTNGSVTTVDPCLLSARLRQSLSSSNAEKAAKPFTVHIDKVKPYLGETE